MYKRSADFKRDALDSLRGRWGISLLVSLIAGIMGANGSSGGGFNYNFGNFDSYKYSGEGSSIMNGFAGRISCFTSPPYFYILLSILAISAALMFIFILAWSIVGASVALGQNIYYIALIRRDAVRVDLLFDRFKIWLKAWGLSLFISLFIALWSLLLVIPGIIASYRYAMAPYIMAQNPDVGIREAVDISKNMMNGNKSRLFMLELSFIGWALLAIFTFGIGLLWLNPYTNAARASFYLEISGQSAPGDPQTKPAYYGVQQ